MMRFVRLSNGLLGLVIATLLLVGGNVFAQTTLVTLEGRVTDEEGAGLPGATITVRNAETGYTKSTASREDGRYIISGIAPGTYECEVSLSGFGAQKR
ncbi:MAG: carboxypeptidase-like regulatory domain-containing protein, partial [Acidobacteriota bacterium]